ncbi:MAG: DEAD/DEAH box helicase family protein [Pseudomonadota bacterium]|nr:DEAD/DEAH box helicase family protein [Pseudomonadota bacterium]
MPLATATTRLADRWAVGVEAGTAGLYDGATPTTAELLRWWFDEHACRSREHNFNAGQRRAIINVIVAHEVLASTGLGDLYRQLQLEVAASASAHVSHVHPGYCLKMASGTGRTWVLQALLAWQMLNATAARDAGREDPRFSRHFLIIVPGLMAHERLLDALLGRCREAGAGDAGCRDIATSDFFRHAELLLPPSQRMRVQQFVQANVCDADEIGRRSTGNGLIALTRWHALAQNAEGAPEDCEMNADPGPTPDAVARRALPLVPGRGIGNRLDALDRQQERGRLLAFLAALPELVVFNAQAHQLHAAGTTADAIGMQWQGSLGKVARRKGRRFVQFDFSAVPYGGAGCGRYPRRLYFPHIVAGFGLREAIRNGLVKSPVLVHHCDLEVLPCAFKAERGARGNIALSEGQRTMLRIGLQELRVLERVFAKVDPGRRPKMLVVCEDTRISPLVGRFLQEEGLHPDDVLTVDSELRTELDEAQWATVRRPLFNIDRGAGPRVIVSALMLREAFDTDNICVIVPLRASQRRIVLEQTMGRGLRPMWREPAFADLRRDNRERIARGETPPSHFDVLTIVEHPAFRRSYDTLITEGLVGVVGPAADTGSTGDLLSVGLRRDYSPFDFAVPVVLGEPMEIVRHHHIAVEALPAFQTSMQDLATMQRQAAEREHGTGGRKRMGRGIGHADHAQGYNQVLSRLTTLLAQGPFEPVTGEDEARLGPFPHLPFDADLLAAALDRYIRERLFDQPFDPLRQSNWRMLLLEPVAGHVVQTFAHALMQAGERILVGSTTVQHRRLSEVGRLTLREGTSIEVDRCIYPRLAVPPSGGFERGFMQWLRTDASVEAFCRVDPHCHRFLRIRYFREDGIAGSSIANFLVRTRSGIHLVETQAEQRAAPADALRARHATAAWCARINRLPASQRSERQWRSIVIDARTFYQWQDSHASLGDLLERGPRALSRVTG